MGLEFTSQRSRATHRSDWARQVPLHFEFEFKIEYFCGLVRIYEIKGVEGSLIADASGNSA